MTAKEVGERERLHTLWATGKANAKQILRCMALDKQAQAEARERRKKGE